MLIAPLTLDLSYHHIVRLLPKKKGKRARIVVLRRNKSPQFEWGVGPKYLSEFPPGYCLINFGGHPHYRLLVGPLATSRVRLSLTSARIKELAFLVLFRVIYDVSSCKLLAVFFLCGRVGTFFLGGAFLRYTGALILKRLALNLGLDSRLRNARYRL